MKLFSIFMMVSLSLLASNAMGQDLRTTPKTVDVGVVSRYKNASFYLHNDTDKSVVITKIEASCGCTRVKYDKEPIAPGDSTKLNLRYKADKHDVGVFYKTISIYTTAERKPLKVSVKGTNKRDE